ncbi:hypothetical protein D9M71_820240 [compost metagenome]
MPELRRWLVDLGLGPHVPGSSSLWGAPCVQILNETRRENWKPSVPGREGDDTEKAFRWGTKLARSPIIH